MKALRKFGILMIVGIIFIAFNQCSESNPDYQKSVWIGPLDPGDLQVWAENGLQLYGGATVDIYTSDANRTAGVIYQEAGTTDHGSGQIYATFYSLPYAKYYIKATINAPPNLWTGQESGNSGIWVPKGTTTNVTIFCN